MPLKSLTGALVTREWFETLGPLARIALSGPRRMSLKATAADARGNTVSREIIRAIVAE
ncbi:hypothetical protein ABGB14_12305 [Nonomuraea sp. B10E15]|uniref:hypothetical protein n=1 Tax=Nonomuraea sp. B10E15 TaxID=3153560 RepID=UPI00325ECFDF